MLALGGSDCELVRDAVLGQPANALSSLAYVVAAAYLLRRRGPRAPAVALAAVGVASFLYHGPMPAGAEVMHDGSLMALAVALGVAAWGRRGLPRPPALALGSLAVGVAANLLTRTGAPLCRPESLVQGHAGWHVLTAVGAAVWLMCWAPARPAGSRSALADKQADPPPAHLRESDL